LAKRRQEYADKTQTEAHQALLVKRRQEYAAKKQTVAHQEMLAKRRQEYAIKAGKKVPEEVIQDRNAANKEDPSEDTKEKMLVLQKQRKRRTRKETSPTPRRESCLATGNTTSPSSTKPKSVSRQTS